MGRLRKINELNISKYIYLIILIILAIYLINSKKRENILFKYVDAQNDQFVSLEKELEEYYVLNGILKSSINNMGYINIFVKNVLKNDDQFNIVALSKFDESTFARAKFFGVLNALSDEISDLNIQYITDYELNVGGKVHQFENLPDFEDTPVIYLLNNKGIILLKFNIKDSVDIESLSYIENIFMDTYIRFKNRVPLDGNQK